MKGKDKMEVIYFFICAYNAEETIGESLESIMNQTYKNWKCHIVDHGSTDSTGKIIAQFVQKDSRFSSEFIPQNVGGITISFVNMLCERVEEGYFATLDADDMYLKNFAEKMIQQIKKEKLDILACGSIFYNAEINTCDGYRRVMNPLVLEGQLFDSQIKTYYPFARTIWGKMYDIKVLKKCDFSRVPNVVYGSDTLFVFETFRNAKRVGITDYIGHRYRKSTNSISSKINLMRIDSSKIVLDEGRKMIKKQNHGEVTVQAEIALQRIFMGAIQESIMPLINSGRNQEAIAFLKKLIEEKEMKAAIEIFNTINGENAFFMEICRWLLKEENLTYENAELISCFFILVEKYPNLSTVYDCEYFRILKKITRDIAFGWRGGWLPNELLKNLYLLYKDEPVLSNISSGFFEENWRMVKPLLVEDYNSVFELAKEKMSDIYYPSFFKEEIFELLLNISSIRNDESQFVYLTKKKIEFYILESKVDVIKDELKEWSYILPDDPEIKGLIRKARL